MNCGDFLKPRRVLMTADSVGGVWTYCLELARALQRYGIEYGLAVMGPPMKPEQRGEAEGTGNIELFEFQCKLEWMDDPWRDLGKAGKWLIEVEEKFRPDIIHLNNYVHSCLPWTVPKLVVGHSCVLSWWKSVKKTRPPLQWDRYRFEVTQGIAAADVVVSPSEAMLWSLQEHYGPIAGSRVIYNGRDPSLFKAGAKEDFIFSAGRVWDEGKNISILENAAPALPWPVYIAGEHREAGSPRRNTKRLGHLPSREVSQWLSRAPIYVLPARYEPFGLSALEAALSGCALILGNIRSLREIWSHSALFVSPDDPEELETVLRWLIRNPDIVRIMASLARDKALEYSADRMARGYYALYRELKEGWTGGSLIDSAREVPANPLPEGR